MRWQPRERRGNRYTVQRKCGRVRRVGAGGNRCALQRSRRWMSREPTSGRTHNSVRPPPSGPPPLPPSNFPRGAAARGDESRAEVRWVRRCGDIFQSARGGQVLTVRGAAVEARCDGSPASGVGNRYTVQREIRWRSHGRRGWESVRSNNARDAG
jgi:hypothetical protein